MIGKFLLLVVCKDFSFTDTRYELSGTVSTAFTSPMKTFKHKMGFV